jgi:hypothetical protein
MQIGEATMRITSLKIVALRKQLPVSAALALAAGLTLPSIVLADQAKKTDECTAETIRGVYMFHASGYNIVSGVPLPKAIIEKVVFDGLGNVTTPAVSLSLNGTIVQPPQGNPGIYTVDADCTGTLTFADGPKFDLQITPNGKQINMLQTNPNTVMQGTAQRVGAAG